MHNYPFVIFAIIFVVSGVINWQRRKRQIATVESFAAATGWRYIQSDPRFTHVSTRAPFNQGTDQCAEEVIEGTFNQQTVAAFDYSFVVETSNGSQGSSRTTERYAVCMIMLPTMLPFLEVGPENVLSRLAAVVGEHDIDIESDAFNRKFTVRSSDPKFASDILSPHVAETLLAMPAEHWRIEGDTLLSWRPGRLDVNGLTGWLTTLSTIVAGVPSFVWHDHGVPTAPPQLTADPTPTLTATPADGDQVLADYPPPVDPPLAQIPGAPPPLNNDILPGTSAPTYGGTS